MLLQTKWMKNEKGNRGKKSVKRKTDIEAPNWPNLKQEDFESEEKVAIVDYLQFKVRCSIFKIDSSGF